MRTHINEFQFNNILELIKKDYAVFAPQKINGVITLAPLANKKNLRLGAKSVVPFKKILWPDGDEYESINKIAFLGLPLCDVHALHILLKKLGTNAPIKRNNILIIASDCKRDSTCFCEVFNADHLNGFDLYIESDAERYKILSDTELGERYLKELKLKESKALKLERDKVNKTFNINNELSILIADKDANSDFWSKIGNNCFGCSACSLVCPLCFCSKQQVKIDESIEYKWDSCFSKSFSEIQNHHDMRPERKDRIYNWYHHKFVRSPHENDDFLCTGCGRCITACPANINIKNILSYFDKTIEDKLK